MFRRIGTILVFMLMVCLLAAGAAAAVVLLVSVCCLRQSMSPGDAGWSYEIGRKSMIQIR